MKISSTGAVCIGFTGFFLAFIVALTWLCYIYEYIEKPDLSPLYSLVLMAAGVTMMVYAQSVYPAARKMEKYEKQKAEDFKKYWETIRNQERRMHA